MTTNPPFDGLGLRDDRRFDDESASRLDWTTGDEPMTGAQASYLETFSREAGEEVPPADLTKAQASERIDALQQQTGRGG